MSIINSTPVRVIAIVGCDGSGKSTLTASLVNELAARMPTEHIYLGQSSGRIGEWISQLPVIGAPFGRYLRSKAAHVHEKPSTPPGNITARVIYLLSCWRAYKFRKMLCKSQQGFLLITDRYPQVEVPGFRFDGPQLAKTTGGNGWIKMLRQRELKLYQWMASYLPVLLIRLGIDEQTAFARKPDHQLAALYCTLIPSMASSTPTGILRAVDRFDLIAVQQATKPFLRAAGSVVAWYFDFGFAGFVIAWYVSNLVGGTMYWWFAARELRRRNIHNAFKLNLFESARYIKGAWSFVWSTNIAHSIWSARNSCSTVLVGIVLGPAAAGLFKIAMTFFDAAGTPAGLLGKSFYPEVMRLDPRTTRPWLLGVKSGLLAGGIGILVALAVLIVGKPLISLVFGVKYLEAYDLIQVMLGAIVISMLGFPQESLLLMAGKQRAFLVAQTIASIGYIVLLFMFCHLFGVLGAAFAYFGGQCLDVALSLIPTLKAFFQRHSLLYNAAGEKS